MYRYSIIGIIFSLLAVSIVSPAFGDECSVCGGSGELTCLSCGGSGEVNCPYCYGTSWILCSKCYGSGLFAGEKCSICDGVGKIKCKRCEETGKVVCAGCGGSGVVKCPECFGGIGILAGENTSTDGTLTDTGNGEVTVDLTTVTSDETETESDISETGDETGTGIVFESTGITGTDITHSEWTVTYNDNKALFDEYVKCELKEFFYDRSYIFVNSTILASVIDGQLKIDFEYTGAGSGIRHKGTALWEELPGKDIGTGALREIELGDKTYKRDEWTFTSYPDYYFWDYEDEWEKTYARSSEWILWKPVLASAIGDLPKLIEKKAKKTDLPVKPKKKHINIVEPEPELYAFEDGNPRATLWRRYLELVGSDRRYIDRDGYYIPGGTVYWWHEKAGVFGSINSLYMLGSYIVSGEDIKAGKLGKVLIYTETVSKKNTLSFYKPDGYGGLYKVWEEEVNIADIE